MAQTHIIATQTERDLDAVIETLEEERDAALDWGFKAVADKIEEALGPLMNASQAAGQYATGVLTPQPPT